MAQRQMAIVLGLCLSSAAVPGLADGPSEADGWHTDFASALAEAERLDRPLVIHFHATWCGPCRQMEQQVLAAPATADQLSAGFVAVKVDADRHEALLKRFEVESLPTDLVVDPAGRVLSRSVGYQGRGEYLSRLARAKAGFDRSRKIRIARDDAQDRDGADLSSRNAAEPASPPTAAAPTVTGETPATVTTPPTTTGETKTTAETESTTPVDERRSDPPQESPADSPVVVEREPAAELRDLGLDGYSPVALYRDRKWVKGTTEFAARYREVEYRLASAQELEEFERDARRYAPRLLGCDPVVMTETDLAIPGSTQFAAYYEGDLYLFVSATSRHRFRASPKRYVRLRHALRVDEILRLSRRPSTELR